MIPIVKQSSEELDPGLLLIYGPPKVGKTTIVNELPSNLILDLEDGAKYLKSISINILGYKPPAGESVEEVQERIRNGRYYLLEAGKELNGIKGTYNFITVDTATDLENMAKERALELYLATPMGKTFKGTDILELERGGGHYYLREAFKELLQKIRNLGSKVILVAHLKDSLLEKKGVEVSVKDVDLTGKLKTIACAKADAVAYVHWGENSSLMFNFKGSDTLICGSRCDHLRGQEIKIAEYDKAENKLVNINWALIYPDFFNTI